MSDIDKVKEKLVTIFLSMKDIILFAEETNEREDFKTLIQPFMEQQRALDHLVRVEAVRLGICPDEDEYKKAKQNFVEYEKAQVNIAAQHIYRGFLDAAEWFSIIMRDKIIKILSPYSTNCISSAIPEYYNELRPKIDSINKELVTLRKKKDSEKDNSILYDHVVKYINISQELDSIYERVSDCISSLEDFKEKEELQLKKEIERENRKIDKEKKFTVKMLILATILSFLSGYLLRSIFENNSSKPTIIHEKYRE